MASLKIKPISFKQAAQYVNNNHRHHRSPVGMKFALACYDDARLCGVVMCGRPVSRILDDGETIEVNRCCTDGTKNACSKLYGAACRVAKEMGYKRAITYVLQSENGASVKSANFEFDGIAGGMEWTGKRSTGKNLPREMKKRFVRTL